MKIKIYEYKTILLPIVLYGCDTWSLILRVFENMILRRIFGLKRDENWEWRRLHNEKLRSFYRSPNIVRVKKSGRLRLAGHVVRMEKFRSVLKILTGKPLDLYEGLGVVGGTILEWILKKLVSIRVIELIWLRIGMTGEPL